MRRDVRETIADWLILFGALGLLVALFLPWSHQRIDAIPVLRGVPRDPTAWQVYSFMDVGLGLLVALLIVVAMLGGRRRRLGVLIATAVALAFTVHAHARPPTGGTVVYAAAVTDHPRAGAGETVAIAALGVAIAGLALSFTAD